MDFVRFLCFSTPLILLLAMCLVAVWQRLCARFRRNDPRSKHRVHGSSEGLAAAFQFLSLAYRPSHAFVAKAQIQQQEDSDDDEDGDPETPLKHLHRQLRRIRRGERVDRLVWRQR